MLNRCIVSGLLGVSTTLILPTPGRGPEAAPQAATAFFVSPAGDDMNDGTAMKPFATLSRAKDAMAAGPIKTTYVKDGVYQLQSTLVLKHRDQGDTILNYPGQTPVISGQSAKLASLVRIEHSRNVTISGLTFSDAGAEAAVTLSDASANTITGNHFLGNEIAIVLAASSKHNMVAGNQIDRSARSAIEVKDGSDANTFDSNLVDGTGAIGTSGGGFLLHGVSGNVISHNLVENTAGIGIGLLNWNRQTINFGNVVQYNLVRDANTAPASNDSGSIYVLGRSQMETRTVIRNNFVKGTGFGHPSHTVGIYLDDLSSGVTVRNNILTGIGSDGMQIHGGRNNSIVNNVIDSGSGRASAILFQAAPADTHPHIDMTNNVITGNIIYSSSPTPVVFVNYVGGKPSILRNLYFSTTGAVIPAAALGGDPQPKFGDPNFVNPAAGDFTIGDGSLASASIGFDRIDQSRIGLAPKTRHWY